MEYKKYFVLNSDVFLVKGAKRGAIYDLKSGNVYSIDSFSANILEQLENGNSVIDSLNGDNIDIQNIVAYLIGLEQNNLGKIINNSYVKEKVEIMKPSGLNFVHFELTEGCNLRCFQCYNKSSPIKIQKKEIGFNDWLRLLKEAYDIGCRRAQFVGGEPFLKRKLLFQLIREARKIGYEFLEVFSNCTLLNNSDLNKLKEYNVHLAVSIYSRDARIHDLITQKIGSWEKTIENIKKARRLQIPIRVAIVIMKQNENSFKELIKFLKIQLAIENVKVDYVRSAGRGCNIDLLSETIIEKQKFREPKFPKINLKFFTRMKFGHNCFLDKICISADGEIHPCVMEREITYGNIKNQSLKDILFSKETKRLTELSKDYIEVCQDCEYRYCCFDCRVKAKNLIDNNQRNFYIKPNWCLYNPYTGRWNE